MKKLLFIFLLMSSTAFADTVTVVDGVMTVTVTPVDEQSSVTVYDRTQLMQEMVKYSKKCVKFCLVVGLIN